MCLEQPHKLTCPRSIGQKLLDAGETLNLPLVGQHPIGGCVVVGSGFEPRLWLVEVTAGAVGEVAKVLPGDEAHLFVSAPP